MTGNQLMAGVARQVISPPSGITLIGYGDRVKGNRGIHDDLTATALVLDDGESCLALVACDLLCLNEYIVDRVRGALEPGIQVVVCCSHTHSGPIAYADTRSSRSRQAYIDSLVGRIVEAVQQGSRDLASVTLRLSCSQADIAINRRERTPDGKTIIGENPSGPVDRTINALSIYTMDGDRLATLVNFACHGTVLGPDNLLVSADWIGAMRFRVEARLGGLVLFLQGATGDLNPKMGWGNEQAWEMARTQGEQVADKIIDAIQVDEGDTQSPLTALPLGLIRQEVWLPLEARVHSTKPPATYRKRILVMARLPAILSPLTDMLLSQRYPWRSRLQPGTGDFRGVWCVPLRISTIRIGDLSLVAFGCETFTEIGMQLKANSAARYTLFASLTDGCIGYLPTAAAYAEGGYEVDIAPYAYRFPGRLAPNSAEIATRAVAQALEMLY